MWLEVRFSTTPDKHLTHLFVCQTKHFEEILFFYKVDAKVCLVTIWTKYNIFKLLIEENSRHILKSSFLFFFSRRKSEI